MLNPKPIQSNRPSAGPYLVPPGEKSGSSAAGPHHALLLVQAGDLRRGGPPLQPAAYIARGGECLMEEEGGMCIYIYTLYIYIYI